MTIPTRNEPNPSNARTNDARLAETHSHGATSTKNEVNETHLHDVNEAHHRGVWCVEANGTGAEVAVSIAKQFAEGPPLEEPEESIRQATGRLIAQALLAHDATKSVKVRAEGGIHSKDEAKKTHTNSLSVSIEPQ